MNDNLLEKILIANQSSINDEDYFKSTLTENSTVEEIISSEIYERDKK